MKIQTPVIVLIFLFIGVALAHAKSQNNIDYATYTRPEVTTTVQPRVFENEVGKTVNLVLTINERGTPIDIIPAHQDANAKEILLTGRVIEAVSQWKFKPARDVEGNAVPATFELPVRINGMTRN